ncbi:MAG: UDP-N-acetylmuramate dehydrogenase [Bdellovibrionota bacterium]
MSTIPKKWFDAKGIDPAGFLLYNEPLAKHTYYRIGGPAAVIATPQDQKDLYVLSNYINETGSRFFILGAGSNVLASDQGFDGLIIKTLKLNPDIKKGENILVVGASVSVSTLLRRAVQEGWGGLEFLTGIPGTVGGVIRMNAGTHLGEARDHLSKVTAFDLLKPDAGLLEFEGPSLKMEYRKNLFLPTSAVVLSTEWTIRLETPAKVKEIVDSTLTRRKATQPIDYPSCGSVFKNPKASGLSSWQVIDKLGLRGHKIGNAQYSEKHCNFILNLGGATSVDVKSLIDLAQNRAKSELNIDLECEVLFIR